MLTRPITDDEALAQIWKLHRKFNDILVKTLTIENICIVFLLKTCSMLSTSIILALSPSWDNQTSGRILMTKCTIWTMIWRIQHNLTRSTNTERNYQHLHWGNTPDHLRIMNPADTKLIDAHHDSMTNATPAETNDFIQYIFMLLILLPIIAINTICLLPLSNIYLCTIVENVISFFFTCVIYFMYATIVNNYCI